uniref:Uncharacterized protein n=1 Tax=viral metagenome TaxID=1070528 RepID=A0A6C0DC73_9ZZZZ
MAKITKILIPLVVGCLVACCFNVISGSMGYKNVALLDKPVSSYDGDIPHEDVKSVNMMQLVKWNVVPAILGLIIWGGVIWYATKAPSAGGEESHEE